MDARRRHYLDALGVEVYVPSAGAAREEPPATPAPEAPAAAAPTPVSRPEAPRAAAPPSVADLDWPALEAAVAACTACELHRDRVQPVFGVGDRDARWMVIGEAPGAEEERRGEPFVGRAGRLLDAMLAAAGAPRERVYIANMLKSRPPGNRDPHADELAACRPFLERQIALVAPQLILAVGRVATQTLLGRNEPIGKLRGTVHRYGERGIPLVAVYHPAYLLRSPGQKRRAWDDLKLACSVVPPVA